MVEREEHEELVGSRKLARTRDEKRNLGLFGLEAAIERLRSCRLAMFTGASSKPVHASLTEALWWVAALNDHQRAHEPGYEARRDADPLGQVVGGLLIARNLTGHELVNVGELRDVTPIGPPRPPERRPDGSQVVYAQTAEIRLSWRELAEIQRGTGYPRREHRAREGQYSARVAGRGLGEVLTEALDFFRSSP